MRSPEDVFRALIDGIGSGRWAEVVDLYAVDAVVEHPMATADGPVPRWLVGTEQLREHFEQVGRLAGLDVQAHDVTVHRTEDPEVIVAEFTYRGTSARSPESFVMPNVFIMRIRDGRIVASRDYQGPPRRD